MIIHACGTAKSEVTAPVVFTAEKQLRVVGTVVKENGTCALYISILQDATQLKIVPANLDERFQVNGMRLRFDYTTVTAKEKSSCPYQWVVLEEVSPLR